MPFEVGVFEDEDAVAAFVALRAARVFVGLGDPDAAAVVDGHRDRLLDVGLGRGDLHREARRHDHVLGGFFGREAGVRIEGGGFGLRQLAGQRLEPRARAVEAEIVEVDVAPAAGALVDDADEDFAALDRLQIDDHRAEVFLVLAGRAVEDAVVVGRDDIDPRLPAAAAADEEAGDRDASLRTSGW